MPYYKHTNLLTKYNITAAVFHFKSSGFKISSRNYIYKHQALIISTVKQFRIELL